MRVTYELWIRASCPSDQDPDRYWCVIESPETIVVERILELVEQVAKMSAYQEDITVWLARHLNCRVTTTGEHYGVKTTCTCGL